ncbi:MAG: SphA family protein [Solidesulfovibrio sp. DCME]|uniref:SphA family protein n=1 Tax=Solidesulfovibrio sp. DCME TaxID=3447380 RepID=UPI003D0D6DF9
MPSIPLRTHHCLSWLVVCLAACLFLAPRQAAAVEGGTSHYIQGAYGDFLMGYIPAPGFYTRNDTIYQAGQIDGALKGGRAYAKLDVYSTLNLTKLSYMFDVPAIDGFLGIGAGVPIIINLHVSGNASANYLSRDNLAGVPLPDQKSVGGYGNRGGLSDIFFMPVIAGWNFGECHLVAMPIVFLPTGYYNASKLTNLGMNYFSFDGNVAFTWLSKTNFELSLNAGYMINTVNPATNYLSGNLLHLDWTTAYHFTPRFALGATGYLLTQTTPDTGSGAKLGAFQSSGSGIGPVASYAIPIGGKDLVFIAKWIHDLGSQHSFLMDTLYASFAIKF